jgi:ribonucleoside-triphosphate reductase
MTEILKPIKINYPKFDNNIDNPYQDEMEKIIDINLASATTTRTLKNITETLTKSLKSKYGIKDKEELKQKVQEILKVHGLDPERLDPIAMISKTSFGELGTVNDISVDDNANKTDNNMTGVCGEAFLGYQKLVGYDYLYQVLKDLYGKEEAKKCSANMYDFSLALNDSTKILLPYCYCVDASKLVTEGRNYGQVHSAPAHRISTYISVLGDTIREISFNLAGAIAIGTFFLDVANLAIYRERITLDDLKSDKKIRKAMTNHFQQFIYTVNHYSRNAVESPFTNVSLFDRAKLKSLIDEDNYEWYFPKKAAVVEDNNLEDTKDSWKNFILDYIEELQEIYIDIFDKGDPLKGGLQFPFPVTTVNLGTMKDENGKNVLMEQDNRLLDYLTKKADISRYNIYSSEGTKVASCCRLISDTDFIAYAGGVNSFGGSQVSLGSHRVITTDFFRCALEASSYDDFKKIITERVEMSGKILKAHKMLILKLEEAGKQPWISNGWIDMTHMFSTFGCVGYVEAAELLKHKFNHKDFDYMKDFLIYFNDECKRIAAQENIIFNIEAIPAEGMAPKLAKLNKLLFADAKGNYETFKMPELLANQWCSLWEDYTIAEKMHRDGEINALMTGGSIVHYSVDSKLTSTQAKTMIMKAIAAGAEHFALNCAYAHCPDCNSTFKGKLDTCPTCQSKNLEFYSRVIGYFSKVSNWNKTRRNHDWTNRKFISSEQFKEELGE